MLIMASWIFFWRNWELLWGLGMSSSIGSNDCSSLRIYVGQLLWASSNMHFQAPWKKLRSSTASWGFDSLTALPFAKWCVEQWTESSPPFASFHLWQAEQKLALKACILTMDRTSSKDQHPSWEQACLCRTKPSWRLMQLGESQEACCQCQAWTWKSKSHHGSCWWLQWAGHRLTGPSTWCPAAQGMQAAIFTLPPSLLEGSGHPSTTLNDRPPVREWSHNKELTAPKSRIGSFKGRLSWLCQAARGASIGSTSAQDWEYPGEVLGWGLAKIFPILGIPILVHKELDRSNFRRLDLNQGVTSKLLNHSRAKLHQGCISKHWLIVHRAAAGDNDLTIWQERFTWDIWAMEDQEAKWFSRDRLRGPEVQLSIIKRTQNKPHTDWANLVQRNLGQDLTLSPKRTLNDFELGRVKFNWFRHWRARLVLFLAFAHLGAMVGINSGLQFWWQNKLEPDIVGNNLELFPRLLACRGSSNLTSSLIKLPLIPFPHKTGVCKISPWYKAATKSALMLVCMQESSSIVSGNGTRSITLAKKTMAWAPHISWSGKPVGIRWITVSTKFQHRPVKRMRLSKGTCLAWSQWNVWASSVWPFGANQIDSQWLSMSIAETTPIPCWGTWLKVWHHCSVREWPTWSQSWKLNGSKTRNRGLYQFHLRECIAVWRVCIWRRISSSAICCPCSTIWSNLVLRGPSGISVNVRSPVDIGKSLVHPPRPKSKLSGTMELDDLPDRIHTLEGKFHVLMQKQLQEFICQQTQQLGNMQSAQ